MSHNPSQPFIRSEMLPPLAPPGGQVGPLKWLRDNLFSGPVNTLLTVAGLITVLALIHTAFPWWWHSVWRANSLAECRQIVAAEGGTSGACWSIIRVRWHQYIFGFYPQALYWRPVLTAGLLLASLAPVLFYKDRKGLWLIVIAGIATLLAQFGIGAPAAALLASAALFAGIAALAAWRPSALIFVAALFPFIGI